MERRHGVQRKGSKPPSRGSRSSIVCDRTHTVSALDDIFMTSNPFRRNRGQFADSGRGNLFQLSAILGCGRISKFCLHSRKEWFSYNNILTYFYYAIIRLYEN